MEQICSGNINAFFTHRSLKVINRAAIRNKSNYALEESYIAKLDSNLKFPIVGIFEHDVKTYRVLIVLDEHGGTGIVDVSVRNFFYYVEWFNDVSENKFYERVLYGGNDERAKAAAHELAKYEGIVLMFDCVMRNKFVRAESEAA
jgi:hypothetical protein